MMSGSSLVNSISNFSASPMTLFKIDCGLDSTESKSGAASALESVEPALIALGAAFDRCRFSCQRGDLCKSRGAVHSQA